MAGELEGRTIAVLATDGVEQLELIEPVKALKGAGAEVKVVSDKKREIQAARAQPPAVAWELARDLLAQMFPAARA
jgi:protease I